MEQEAQGSQNNRAKLLKTLPGFLVSAFFLWWTFGRVGPSGKRGFDPAAFHEMHVVAPIWLLGVVLFSIAGYGLAATAPMPCCAASVHASLTVRAFS